ncbi:MAG: hypothetical protein HUJ25_12405 [Crocinitomicaceae bacterium]|nr:hypothetical protein [Crocinitomicaceae bacterium]
MDDKQESKGKSVDETKKEFGDLLIGTFKRTFELSALPDMRQHYFSATKKVEKWMCYSDYAIGNSDKPNDVITFTLVPYVDDFVDLAKYIQSLAKKDIKKTRTVNEDFTTFLKTYPLLNVSFVLTNNKYLFFDSRDNLKQFLENNFKMLTEQCDHWKKTTPGNAAYYETIKKKYKCVLELVKKGKKLDIIANMVLTTLLGAYVSSIVVEEARVKKLGWFSDRDAINDVCDNVSIDLFYRYLWGIVEYGGEFLASPASSKANNFYEEFARLPDYIAGTIADYDFRKDHVSKDKFTTVLREYISENTHNNFIFRLDFNHDGKNTLSMTRVMILNKKSIWKKLGQFFKKLFNRKVRK